MPARVGLARVGLTVFLVGLCAAAVCAQPSAERGRYYRCDDPAFELWIPAGLAPRALTEEEKEDDGYPLVARFYGETVGAHDVSIQIYPGGYSDPDEFIRYDQECAKESRPDATLGSGGEYAAGPFRAGICWEKGGRKKGSGYENLAMLKAGVLFNSKRTIEIVLYLEGPRFEAALQQLKWMLDTLRRPGEAGLGAYLDKRRIDTETGLSYRPPRGLAAVAPAAGAAHLYRAEGGDPPITVSVSAATGKGLRQIVAARGRGRVSVGVRRSFPHEPEVEAELLGGLFRSDDKSSAVAVIGAQLEQKHFFVVAVEGPFTACDRLLRTAELTAMGLRYVDVEAARAAVNAALARLEAAKTARDSAAIRAALEVLARHPYLEAVPAAVAGALKSLPDTSSLEAAGEVLAEHGSAAEFPALLAAARYFRSRRDPAALAALVPALALIRGDKAVPFLLDLARRKDEAPAIAAILALGHYPEPACKVAPKLVALMARAEAAGRKSHIADRERWLRLGPAYREALARLTGRTFASAAEAKAWLRK